jgi:hypothetical protein
VKLWESRNNCIVGLSPGSESGPDQLPQILALGKYDWQLLFSTPGEKDAELIKLMFI